MSRNGVDIAGKVESACDLLRQGNCVGALQYIPELTWILFLRMLDEREEKRLSDARALGVSFTPTLSAPYRWRDWASPEGKKRAELSSRPGAFLDFVRDDLFPHLQSLKNRGKATPRQKALSEIIIGTSGPSGGSRVNTGRLLLDVLDLVDGLREAKMDTRHGFPISRVYEALLLKMGEHGNDGGQFFTPREVIRAMVRVVDPRPGEKVLDPCCGTGGFLAQTLETLREECKSMPTELDALESSSFYGREKESLIYPLALANLVLHGMERPNVWHGNTLTGKVEYDGLFSDAPESFDVVLTNPPFGAKDGPDASQNYDIPSKSTQVLFVQEIIRSLSRKGRCGVVLDEGFMFGVSDRALVRTKRKLLDECDLWCVVSLPQNAFASVGANVKTNLLFFNKGKPTSRIWYYDLSGVKLTKKRMLTSDDFAEFFGLLPGLAEGGNSWVVDFKARLESAGRLAAPHMELADQFNAEAARIGREIPRGRLSASERARTLALRAEQKELRKKEKEAKNRAQRIRDAAYDLKAVNPNRKASADLRTPGRLLGIVSGKNREISALLSELEKA